MNKVAERVAEAIPNIAALVGLACCIKILNEWAKPGNYWFVMPPRPGSNGPHTLYMSSGKAFEGTSHEDVIEQAARYLEPTLEKREEASDPAFGRTPAQNRSDME